MNRNFFRTCTLLGAIGAIGVLASCGESSVGPKSEMAPSGPSFNATQPFNNGGACMGNDAVAAPTGTIPGVKLGGDPLKAFNCTSNDVRIARTNLLSYQTSDLNGNFGPVTQYNAGDNVTCLVGTNIKLNLTAELDETASSGRTDIGIWIATDGGKAITGACNHYNLVPGTQNVTNEPVGASPGPDSCGDLNAGAIVPAFPLGEITAVCTTASTSSTLLHVGSCLGWKEPGADKFCPITSPPDGAAGFRFGTLPGNASKCNCDGFDVPITVVRDPSISLTKTADSASISAGSQLGFTVTVSNGGPGTATTLAVNDPLPAGTGVNWSIETPVTGWSITGTAPNQTLVFSAATFGITSSSVHVISGTTSGSCQLYTNTATVTLGNGTAPAPATATTTVGCPTIGITKLPATQTKNAGESFSWTVVLTNNGPGTSSGATINDPLPALTGVTYTLGAGSDASCAITAGTLACGPKNLAVNGTITAVINATTTAGTSCSSSGITNTATGKATGVSDVTASATTTINCPSLGITKLPATQTKSAGESFSWTVTLTNNGTGTAVGATINDPLPALTGVSYTVGAGSDASCGITAGTLTCGPKDLAASGTLVAVINATTTAGTSCSASGITNTATGKATGVSDVTASAKTTLNCPTLGITKLPATQTKNAGESFTWTVVLTNSGAGTAVGATINDPLPVVTGVSYVVGAGSDASCVITAGTLTCGPKDLAQNGTITAVINATTTSAAACSASGFTNTATGSATGVSNVTASAKTTIPCPNLSIVKKPDQVGDTGYSVTPPDSARFTITVSNSSATGTGTANNVVLTDTLPAGLTWVANNTTDCPSPMGTVTGADSKTHQRLICNIGSLAAGASFTVNVAALVPASFVQVPPSASGTPIEIDGDLADDGAAGKDWASLGSTLIDCTSNPKVGCDLDKSTGTGDDSFGQGTKEDTPVPSVVSGSIPNNKSDLLRFYVSSERFVTTNFLYLAWERVQAPNGTTNMDFELNQSKVKSANGVTPVRTAGDILIKYDLDKGGSQPTLGFHRWFTSGNPATVCEASSSLPCWGKGTALLTGAAASVNLVSVTDPILAAGQSGSRSLDALTFGEASIDLQTTGIFQAGACTSFGQGYLKSRSSSSFTSEIKDFIAPIPLSVTNCAPVLILNKAWVTASNVTGTSDSGEIKVESP
jgi:uncharacterized repeat protein (TIGR01451 family)